MEYAYLNLKVSLEDFKLQQVDKNNIEKEQ